MKHRGFTKDQFISKSRATHGDKYDYTKSDYKISCSRVVITCPTHGDFTQVASDHWGGHGCRLCYDSTRKTWTIEDDDFLRKFYKSHGADYCARALYKTLSSLYSRAQIIGLSTKIQSIKPYEDIHPNFVKSIIRGAKNRNLSFEIDAADIWNLYISQNKKCALTGWDIVFSLKSEITASVDRINSDLGYTKDNIQLVHKKVNRSKVNYTDQFFYKMCDSVSKYRKCDFTESHTEWILDEWSDTEKPRNILTYKSI